MTAPNFGRRNYKTGIKTMTNMQLNLSSSAPLRLHAARYPWPTLNSLAQKVKNIFWNQHA
jgi:hypothetical protein